MRRTVLVAALLAAGEARAQSESVEAMIERGIALRRRGRDAEAHALFDAAWSRCRCVEAMAHRGLAANALGRWLDAERDLSTALEATQNPLVRAYARDLWEELAAIRTHLATITVATDVGGARASVDDAAAMEVPQAGLPLRLPAGDHTLVIEAAGRVTLRRSLRAVGGQDTRIELVMAPAEPPPSPPEPDAPRPIPAPRPRPVEVVIPRREVPLRWLVAGGAALLVGVGANVTQQVLVAAWNDDACLAGGRSRGENCVGTGIAADVTLGLAIAGYVAGASLLTVGFTRWTRRPSATRAWTCGPMGLGASCAAAF